MFYYGLPEWNSVGSLIIVDTLIAPVLDSYLLTDFC